MIRTDFDGWTRLIAAMCVCVKEIKKIKKEEKWRLFVKVAKNNC